MAVNVFRWLLPRLLAAVTGLLLAVDPAAATEDFIYQVLDATQVVEFQARYLDTDQEGTFHIVIGDVGSKTTCQKRGTRASLSCGNEEL
jgi:hypothetical protein